MMTVQAGGLLRIAVEERQGEVTLGKERQFKTVCDARDSET